MHGENCTEGCCSKKAARELENDLLLERSWEEDFPHENGKYYNACHLCEKTFLGHKRRVTCKLCADKYCKCENPLLYLDHKESLSDPPTKYCLECDKEIKEPPKHQCKKCHRKCDCVAKETEDCHNCFNCEELECGCAPLKGIYCFEHAEETNNVYPTFPHDNRP